MIKTGKIQESYSGITHFSNLASIDAFYNQAKPGSIYVEFDVPKHTVTKGGTDAWRIIHVPGSMRDRLNAGNRLPRITECYTIGGNK